MRRTGLVVVLMGLPGAGKGTQAQLLADRGWSHINVGGLIRSEVAAETAWGIQAAAVSAMRCRGLARRLRQDRILVEVSVTSNVALGAVPALRAHPLPWLLDNDIPACLNTDVPLHLGTDLPAERQAVTLLMGNDRQVLEAMEGMAQHHRFGGRLEAPRPVTDPRAGQIKP